MQHPNKSKGGTKKCDQNPLEALVFPEYNRAGCTGAYCRC